MMLLGNLGSLSSERAYMVPARFTLERDSARYERGKYVYIHFDSL